jgi:hypothetical protein
MRLATILVTLTVVLLAGCSSDESTGSTSTTSTARATTTIVPSGGGSPSSGSPIPESTAVDALTQDLTKPAAADLVAKCTAFATAFLANGAGGNEAAALGALTSLADVVRPIDPAVAEALVGHPGAAAAWCRAKGMTNI